MSPNQAKNLVKRILAHKETIRTADEAMIGCLQLLVAGNAPGQVIKAGKKFYRVEDIFGETDATWRPARIHKYHLVEVK